MPKRVTPEAGAASMGQPGIVKYSAVFDIGNAKTNLNGGQIVKAEGPNGEVILAVPEECPDSRSILGLLPKANRLKALPRESVFTYGGHTWVMGEACYEFAPNYEDNVAESRYLSSWYKTMFAGAIWRLTHRLSAPNTIIEMQIISSIPAKLFKAEGFADLVKKHLQGSYRITSADGLTEIVANVKVKIAPEGIGSYWSVLYSQDENWNQFAGINVIVADLGFMSLDAVHANRGDYVADSAMSATNIGVEHIAQAVEAKILAESGVSLPLAEIDSMIQDLDPFADTCAISVNDHVIEIGEVLIEAWTELARRAVNWIATVVRGKNVAAILLTGGGARMLFKFWPEKSALPRAVVIPDAPRANVEGGWLYLSTL